MTDALVLAAVTAVAYLVGVRTGPALVGWLNEKADPPGERPWTNAEIADADCFRCGQPAQHQWQVCADDNIWRPLCWACDVELNRRTLEWMGHPRRAVLMAAYVESHPQRG